MTTKIPAAPLTEADVSTVPPQGQNILDVVALFEGHPERYTTKDYALDAQGGSVTPLDPQAVKWCVLGAFTKCGISTHPLYDALYSSGHKIGVVSFVSSHPFEQVIDFLKRLANETKPQITP